MQDFSFTISINTEKSEEDIFNLILKEVPESIKEVGAHIRLFNNIMKFDLNSDYNPLKISDSQEGYLYYKYFLDVFPVGEVDLENQKRIITILINLFKKYNFKAELIAEEEFYE